MKSDLTDRIAIPGLLLSEIRDIYAMIRFVLQHPNLRYIIVCCKEVKSDRAGHALLSFARNSIEKDERIVGASRP
ncbi:MAG TPA: hypothetical protein VGJ42_00280 [Nitrososphaera sp.]